MIAIYENKAHSETALALCEYVISNDCLPALVSMCEFVIPIHPMKDSSQHECRKKIYAYNFVSVLKANTVKYDHALLVVNVVSRSESRMHRVTIKVCLLFFACLLLSKRTDALPPIVSHYET
jgi:hypothetical protein